MKAPGVFLGFVHNLPSIQQVEVAILLLLIVGKLTEYSLSG